MQGGFWGFGRGISPLAKVFKFLFGFYAMKVKEGPALKFFFGLFRDYKQELSSMIAIAAFGSILAAFVPYIYGRMFDLALIPNTTVSLLASLIFVWAFFGLVSNYTSTKTATIGDALGAKVSLQSEAEAYSHFLTLPISFHKTKKTGEILEKVSRGSWNLQSMIEIASDIMPSILFLAFALIAMTLIQWQLALIVVFTFLVYGLITLKMTPAILKAQQKMNKVFEREYGTIYDKLYNVFLIKNFTMEESEKKNFFNSLIKKAAPSYRESANKSARLSHIQGIIYNISFVAVLGIAILFLRNGQITQGEFVMFFGYINLSFSPFFRLSTVYKQYRRSMIAIKRLMWLKKIVPEAMKHGNKTIENFNGKIEFKKVDFGYIRNKKTLRGINLKINAGESVALVGKSGVGKTTLSELILGYYKPSKGKIYLDNDEISKLKLQWLREQIAIVPQEISILNDTLINNIKYASPNSSFKEIVNAAKAANAHDFIISLPKKYNSVVGERGIKLSVGQKQRIALTMAFLKNPKILVLDEPTSALDAESERKVQQGIKRLIKGRTTIIIAHRFSTVRDADKIVVLDKGKIAEVGNHKDLLKKKGKYCQLYRLQAGLD